MKVRRPGCAAVDRDWLRAKAGRPGGLCRQGHARSRGAGAGSRTGRGFGGIRLRRPRLLRGRYQTEWNWVAGGAATRPASVIEFAERSIVKQVEFDTAMVTGGTPGTSPSHRIAAPKRVSAESRTCRFRTALTIRCSPSAAKRPLPRAGNAAYQYALPQRKRHICHPKRHDAHPPGRHVRGRLVRAPAGSTCGRNRRPRHEADLAREGRRE